MSLATLDLYNDPAYSDITIAFSGRSVYCHKLILCTKSEYFAKLCGPDSTFAESKQQTVELKEDDPDAVEHVLRYIYTSKHDTGQDAMWQLQLQISNAAHKVKRLFIESPLRLTFKQYLLPDLATAALSKLRDFAQSITDTEQAFTTLVHIRHSTLLPEALEVAQELETEHLHDLLRLPGYRELVEEDTAVMWNYLDQFNSILSAKKSQPEQPEARDDLIEVDLCICLQCQGVQLTGRCASVSSCSDHGSFDPATHERMQIWVPQAKFNAYRQRLSKNWEQLCCVDELRGDGCNQSMMGQGQK